MVKSDTSKFSTTLIVLLRGGGVRTVEDISCIISRLVNNRNQFAGVALSTVASRKELKNSTSFDIVRPTQKMLAQLL